MLTRFMELRKRYGPIYGVYRGFLPQLIVADADIIKDILVRDWHAFADRTGGTKDGNPITDNFLTALSGNEWKRMRSVISPTFTSGKMKHMFEIMNDCCRLMIDNIRKKVKEDKDADKRTEDEDMLELNIRHLAGCYSMDVIAKCCFATETNSFDDPDHVFVSHARRSLRFPKWKIILSFILPNWIRRMIKFTISPKESLDFFVHVSRSILNQRRANGDKSIKQVDYLQLMIEASKGELASKVSDKVPDHESHHGYEYADGKITDSLSIGELKKPLSTDEIISNSVLFLGVGYDTTSTLISMTSYCLACNQDVQSRLFEELKESYEKNENSFNYETISGLKYLDATISETLRVLPSLPIIERRAVEDYTFKKNGMIIKKGGSILLPVWAIHHDVNYFDEPDKFDPTRFLPENRSKITPYSYIPFGGGPRNCIGMRFALLEAKLAIAHLILNYKFDVCSKTDIPLDLTKTTALLNPKRVFVGVQERE